ncbi:RloB family protein [Pseudoalteromonas fuliginea]|uniref:RloB family protein n=1 Tax=Pseudoalteromonas TaxID=53246 RepID=UPI0002AA9728|nr:RloB family protein [Pseudoalteromonas sp. Bsw20308]ALQ07754.1 hypothetical protein D172_006585 [Pseudoalteromonas sp. Bsw20308]
MGKDDIFNRRKRAAKIKQERKAAKRAPYETVLVVTEGLKTEPNYLNELVSRYKLSVANIVIDGESDSSPSSILKYAKQQVKKSKAKGFNYDRIYCVFDKDSHTCYEKTVIAIKNLPGYYCIKSVPCFEFWLLLHFTYTTASIVKAGKKSPGDKTLQKLKQFLPDYSKGAKNTFSQLEDKLNVGIRNSKKSLEESLKTGCDNPSTNMHELVEFLINIKK